MDPQEQTTLFDAMTCDVLDLIEHAGEVDQRVWPQRLHQLFEIHRAYNRTRLRMPDAQAAADARDRSILLGDYLGGRQFILPRGDALRQALRDKQIWLEFTGNNAEALAEKHKLHITHLYRILREQRVLFTAKIQGRLFDAQN